MIGVKLTFHIAALAPRRTASPECSTKRAGYGRRRQRLDLRQREVHQPRVLDVEDLSVAWHAGFVGRCANRRRPETKARHAGRCGL